MKFKIIIFALLCIFTLNLRLVFQPEYDHYVIGNHLEDSCIVFSSKGIDAIWIGDNLYVPATEMDYMNY